MSMYLIKVILFSIKKQLKVIVDKASNNIVFVCKSYYFEYLIKELGINSNKDEILANHRSFMTSLNNINRVNPQTL
jgi:hypothetical protein